MKRTCLLQPSIFAAFLIVWAPPAWAQSTAAEDALELATSGQKTEFGFGAGSFLAVPIPFSNPTLGNGLAGGVAWLFTADEDSRTSSIGIGGFRSDNDSNGTAFSLDLNLRANRYQLSFLAGAVDLNYDFTAGPFDIPLNQSGDLYQAEIAYGFTQEFSLGFAFEYAETGLSPNFDGPLPPEVSAALDLDVFKFGLTSEWDTRDTDLYPTTGALVTFDMYRGEVEGGLDQDYEKAVLQGSVFRSGFGAKDVIALAGTLCQASDKAPFFDACSIGLTDGLRGFSVTEYIGDSLVSAQAEYRGRLGNSRLGYSAFVGAGSVGGSVTSESGVHAAAGVGVRYRLSKQYPVDFSVDATINSDSESLFYLYVGQSF